MVLLLLLNKPVVVLCNYQLLSTYILESSAVKNSRVCVCLCTKRGQSWSLSKNFLHCLNCPHFPWDNALWAWAHWALCKMDQSEDSIQATWSLSTNERPVYEHLAWWAQLTRKRQSEALSISGFSRDYYYAKKVNTSKPMYLIKYLVKTENLNLPLLNSSEFRNNYWIR